MPLTQQLPCPPGTANREKRCWRLGRSCANPLHSLGQAPGADLLGQVCRITVYRSEMWWCFKHPWKDIQGGQNMAWKPMGVNFKNRFGSFTLSANFWNFQYFMSCRVMEIQGSCTGARFPVPKKCVVHSCWSQLCCPLPWLQAH